MTKEEAEKLSIVFLQIAGRLNETAAFVRDKESTPVWHDYRRGIGNAMADVFELGERLWKRFPELRPEQLGGPYKVDRKIYEPAFYVWDDQEDLH